MPDLRDGESTFMQGSGSKPYELKNVGGVYSCTCPAWRNQSLPIERRTCKHLRRLRGDAAEELSARNRFRGVVRAVEVDGFLARVELDVTAPTRVVAIITREAAEELELGPGRAATAIVKSTSVMVER
jgi:molybdopterin-binding protein